MKKVLLSLVICLFISSQAHAALTRLTPEHIYKWADSRDDAKLYKYRRGINVKNEKGETALCLAQSDNNKPAYEILLRFGASKNVDCHKSGYWVVYSKSLENYATVPVGAVTNASSAAAADASIGVAAGAAAVIGGGAIIANMVNDSKDDKKRIFCRKGYSASLTEAGQCGVGGSSGWSLVTDKEVPDSSLGRCNTCVANECAPATHKSCPTVIGLKYTEVDTGKYSADDKCYRCAYVCDNSQLSFVSCPSSSKCVSENITTIDGSISCYIVTEKYDSSQRAYETKEACETMHPGWNCDVDPESPFNAYIPVTRKMCPVNEHKSCSTVENLNVSSSESGNYSGDDKCYTCTYSCNVSAGALESCPQGLRCEAQTIAAADSAAGSKVCQFVAGADESVKNYDTKERCEEVNPWYICNPHEIDNGSGGTVEVYKPDQDRPCPANEYLSCPTVARLNVFSTETTSMSGTNKCYSCTYVCDASAKALAMCPTYARCGDITFEGTAAEGLTCREVTGLADDVYDNKTDCEAALQNQQRGYHCKKEEIDVGGGDKLDAWISDLSNLRQCSEFNAYDSCETGVQYLSLVDTPIGKYSGTTECHTCTYSCDSSQKAYEAGTVCPVWGVCSNRNITTATGTESSHTCVVVTGPNNDNLYYEDTPSCQAALNAKHWGFECVADEESGYTKIDKSKIVYCPGETLTSCPTVAKLSLTSSSATGEYQGEGQACYQCVYACNNAQEVYEIGSCPASASGCTEETETIGQTADGSSTITKQCLVPSGPKTGYYTNEEDCLEANAAEGFGCKKEEPYWTKDADNIIPCDAGTYVTGSCPVSTNARLIADTPTATEKKSGGQVCVVCNYKCATSYSGAKEYEQGQCPDSAVCSTSVINLPDGTSRTHTCEIITGPKSGYFENETACKNYYEGFSCTQVSETDYWTKGEPMACPNNEYVTCPVQDYLKATATQTTHRSGNDYCHTCSYSCDVDQGVTTEVTDTQDTYELPDGSTITCYLKWQTSSACDGISSPKQYYSKYSDCASGVRTCAYEAVAAAGGKNCYYKNGCDATKGYYTSTSACLSDAPNYQCNGAVVDGCVHKGDISTTCSQGYSTTTTSCGAGYKISQDTVIPYVGIDKKACNKCVPKPCSESCTGCKLESDLTCSSSNFKEKTSYRQGEDGYCYKCSNKCSSTSYSWTSGTLEEGLCTTTYYPRSMSFSSAYTNTSSNPSYDSSNAGACYYCSNRCSSGTWYTSAEAANNSCGEGKYAVTTAVTYGSTGVCKTSCADECQYGTATDDCENFECGAGRKRSCSVSNSGTKFCAVCSLVYTCAEAGATGATAAGQCSHISNEPITVGEKTNTGIYVAANASGDLVECKYCNYSCSSGYTEGDCPDGQTCVSYNKTLDFDALGRSTIKCYHEYTPGEGEGGDPTVVCPLASYPWTACPTGTRVKSTCSFEGTTYYNCECDWPNAYYDASEAINLADLKDGDDTIYTVTPVPVSGSLREGATVDMSCSRVICNTSAQFYGDSTACATAVGRPCELSQVTTDNVVRCFAPVEINCPTGSYANKTACLNAYPGYACTQSTGSDCWSKSTSSSSCRAGYSYVHSSSYSTACDSQNSGTTVYKPERDTEVPYGSQSYYYCYKCVVNYECGSGYSVSVTLPSNTESTYYYKVQESSSKPKCYKQSSYTCDTEHGYKATITGASSCGNSLGYSVSSQSGQTGCKKCNALSCNSGYIQTDNCGGNQYLTYVQDTTRYAGNEKCGKCTCNAQKSTTQCKDTSDMQPALKFVSSSVVGTQTDSSKCYTCAYQCDTSNGYHANEEDGDQLFTRTYLGEEYQCYFNPNTATTFGMSSVMQILMHNTDDIQVTSVGEEDVYGLSTSDYGDSVGLASSGNIEIEHNSTGNAYGMAAFNGNAIHNYVDGSISIHSTNGGNAYGMYGDTGSEIYNEGLIHITGNAENAYGIYGEGGNIIENSGVIDVSGENAYGIYVNDGQDSVVTNTAEGSINVNASGNAYGIYINQNSDKAVVNNYGSITVNGDLKEGESGIYLNGAELHNYQTFAISGKGNLNVLGGAVYLEAGGTYQAEELEGDLIVGTSVVAEGQQNVYTEDNALMADNTENLELISQSAMFEAKKEGNNAVLVRKDFAEFVPNKSIAEYLNKNYEAGNLSSAYDKMKEATTAGMVSAESAKLTGADSLPNMVDENMQTMKSLNRNIADTLLKPTDEVHRVIAGSDMTSIDTDDKGLLSGYDMNASSMYTFGDTKVSNNNRFGLGLSYTTIDTSYNVGGNRKLSILNLFLTNVHKFTDNLSSASILGIGYGTGRLDRGDPYIQRADINDIFYAFTNELRYTMDLSGMAELEPALMLNVIGYEEDDLSEKGSSQALKVKGTHNLSAEAGVGLFLKREMSMSKYGKLGMKIGGIYYRELADPYDEIRARNVGGTGSFVINDYAGLYKKDRAILEAAIDYEYKALSVVFKYNKILQKNNPEFFDLGLRYAF